MGISFMREVFLWKKESHGYGGGGGGELKRKNSDTRNFLFKNLINYLTTTSQLKMK